jgi:hypothetical protein
MRIETQKHMFGNQQVSQTGGQPAASRASRAGQSRGTQEDQIAPIAQLTRQRSCLTVSRRDHAASRRLQKEKKRKEKKRARLNISVPHVCPDPVLTNDRFRWPSHKRRFQLTATTARRVERAHSRPSDCIHHKDRGWIHSRDVQELVLVRTQLGESEPCCCCFVVQQHQKKRFLSAAAQCFVRTNTFLLLLLLPRDRNTN